MQNLAIIPARGGSKRIPRKNIKNFLGKPIIAYSIEAALRSELFEEVMISTEDEEITQIGKQYGAKIPFVRSIENSNDFATTVDVLLEVIDAYEKEGIFFEYACCIYPTAPFVSSEILIKAYNQITAKKFDTVFPVLRYSFPIQRAMKIIESDKIAMFYPEFLSARAQDLEPSFHDAGQFYWFDVSKLKTQKKLWSNNTGYVETNELQAQDIDNEIDWKLAELKYELLQNTKYTGIFK